ncbi:MAG: SUMF1/EgtB/PvdO family nonheme iron enzyme [Flavobacteriaceae bacterium]|nr:SUMF1/EgtB/PvdO family nonheme iron enzyme [Bacteroidia bacterium]NNL59785.1 SUMF1/EgtB/PvdO family nonheme iron enzyme [Flavobacteriaceae bacterium]
MNNSVSRLLLLLIFVVSCNSQNDKKDRLNQFAENEIKDRKDSLEIIDNRYSTGKQYLSFSKIELNETRFELTFEVKWDESWREGDEYDAAWTFIKKRMNDGSWKHLIINPDAVKIESHNPSNDSEGIVRVSPDGVGMIINRLRDGQGNNHWKIRVTLTKSEIENIKEFRVFGLEMVHVTKGPFELGTLKGERDRREVLTQGAGGAPYDPFFTYKSDAKNNYGGVFKVNSEETINIGKQDGNLYWIDANIPGTNTFSGIPEGQLNPEFPKGVKGFYQMKYELSQQEYCDFLNTLTREQQEARDFTKIMEFKRPISDYRNMITKDGNGYYSTTRPNRPCNFISWLDGQAFADWAGLRHMTELEFEKSCRGPNKAVYREYVWGVNEIRDKSNMRYVEGFYEDGNLISEETGDEETDGNIHASMFSYKNFIDVCTRQGNFYDPSSVGCRSFKGGDGGRGPVRKGIFGVTSDGNRIKAGATYFGAMEMGGNLQEPVVTIGHPSGRKFKGTHGNGELTEKGFADNEDWQPVKNDYAFAGRGGCWKFHENHARTSDRFKGLRQNEKRRASHIGFRGVRTAWN